MTANNAISHLITRVKVFSKCGRSTHKLDADFCDFYAQISFAKMFIESLHKRNTTWGAFETFPNTNRSCQPPGCHQNAQHFRTRKQLECALHFSARRVSLVARVVVIVCPMFWGNILLVSHCNSIRRLCARRLTVAHSALHTHFRNGTVHEMSTAAAR